MDGLGAERVTTQMRKVEVNEGQKAVVKDVITDYAFVRGSHLKPELLLLLT